MKKYILILITVIVSCHSYSQSPAAIVKDTAIYLGHRFALNDTITVGYGSKADKGFAFCKMGSDLAGYNDLMKEFSRYDAVIDKIKKVGRIVYIRAKFTEKNLNILGGNKLLVDLEGAIDNKELRL